MFFLLEFEKALELTVHICLPLPQHFKMEISFNTLVPKVLKHVSLFVVLTTLGNFDW